MGFPQNVFIFFFGILLLPPRAGIIATLLIEQTQVFFQLQNPVLYQLKKETWECLNSFCNNYLHMDTPLCYSRVAGNKVVDARGYNVPVQKYHAFLSNRKALSFLLPELYKDGKRGHILQQVLSVEYLYLQMRHHIFLLFLSCVPGFL